ncbi:MAG: TetR/AcrR family transcriptional regulator [Acutalibacteraceae bacterium]
MNTKDNQRTRITKIMLKDAMIDLMQEKPVNKITIKEICEKAQINRSTFYLHYNEPNDLLKSIEDEIIENTADYLKKIGAEINDSAIRYILLFIRYIKENDKVFRTLLVKNDSQFFKKKFVILSLEKCLTALNCTADENIKKYVFGYAVNGCISVIIEWIESDYKLPDSEVASLLYNLSKCVMAEYVV